MSTFLIRSATSQSSSYPIVLTRLGGPRSRSNPDLKFVEVPGDRTQDFMISSQNVTIIYITNINNYILIALKGKIPLGRPRRRWEDNIRSDFKEIGINTSNWVDSAKVRNYWRSLVNAVLSLQFP